MFLFFSSAEQVHAGERHSVHAGFLLVDEKKKQVNLLGFPEKKSEKLGAICLVLDMGQTQRTTA